jgi:hypothetical protein
MGHKVFSSLNIRRFLFLLLLVTMAMKPCAYADQASSVLLNLMFPPATGWEAIPVVKWDHPPMASIIVEEGASKATEETISQAVAEFLQGASVLNISVAKKSDRNNRSANTSEHEDISIIIGPSAIEESNKTYRPMLLSVMPSEASADATVASAIESNEPTLNKYKFDVRSGRMTRAVSFINIGDNATQLKALVLACLFASMSPSSMTMGSQMGLIQSDNGDAKISVAGYGYLKILYSSLIPIGSKRNEVRRILYGD